MSKRAIGGSILLCAALAAFFTLLFCADNKYKQPPPYGDGGVIALSEMDLNREAPIYLIDGWLLTDARETDRPTYIGEFSNLQRGDRGVSPHGGAIYRLRLRYTGGDVQAAIDFPMLFARHEIWLDGVPLDAGVGDGRIFFPLTAGDYVLEVRTSSSVGYYSGMYYPPALGRLETVTHFGNLRTLAYALALLVPLALALFTLLLWRTGGGVTRWFGLLCCAYALYVSYYFVRLFRLSVAEYWFYAETAALYALIFCVVKLCAKAAKAERYWFFKVLQGLLLALPCVLLGLCPLFPVFYWAVPLHGMLTDTYFILAFCAATFLFLRALARREGEYRWVLAGCALFGVGLLLNLTFSNRFEPMRFFWQFEWCGVLLVGLFGGMMAARNSRILTENATLTEHLEEQVTERTAQLHALLEERKSFFSDMAHDLKAPVFATRSFIAAIRESGLGVDHELERYLDLAESKQQEMARRLQGLSTINALDKLDGARERLSVHALLDELYAAFHAEAEVSSIHFVVEPPPQDVDLWAQRERLELLFENLIYNALRATPPNGHITISAKADGKTVSFTVSDTGCGIPEEELPNLFDRFFVGARNRDVGSGLGLYIVKSIVRELNGEISLSSVVNEGTTFTIFIPLTEQ